MKLSIVISSRNDPVGSLITIRSALEEFKGCDFKCEVVIVDNSDLPMKKQTLRDLAGPFISSGEVKLVNQNFPCLFSARDRGVEVASGEYIMVVDSHCLFYRDTVNNMVHFADKCNNLGMLFGSVCYSIAHEQDAYCDRDAKTFLPIRRCAYPNYEKSFKVPLRSMPYLIKRRLYRDMRGYRPLSKHRLVWGGGDFLISFKPLILGFDNWSLMSSGVIHLGPFADRGFFISSFLPSASSSYSRFVGMLTAAFVIGGRKVLRNRFKQLLKRVKNRDELERMKKQAVAFGSSERKWLANNSIRSYDDIVKIFEGSQGNHFVRRYQTENILPKAYKSTI